jgi:hypothetical protein
MATYSTSLKLTLIGDGEQTGTWGQTTNTNLGTLLEQAIVGQTTITMANADYTLTNLNGVTDEARNAVIIVTGNQNATYSVIVPAVQKLYMVTNSLSSSAIAYIKPSGGSTIQVPNGRTMYLYCTGTAFVALDYVQYAQNIVSGGSISTGAITCTSLTSSGGVSGTTGVFSGAVSGTTGTFSAGVSGTTGVFSGAISGTSVTASTQFNGSGAGLSGTASGLSIGGNAATATTATTVSTTIASGAVGTTQTAGDNSTKIATTAYVATAVSALGTFGTMSTQNANNVAITGGTINGVTGTNAGMTVGTATNATNATNATTATNATNLVTTNFTITESGGKLLFKYGATTIASLDSTGVFTTLVSNVSGGTP